MKNAERQQAWTGRRIRSLRTAKAMTQGALAAEMRERSGQIALTERLGQSTVSKWESGASSVALRYRRWLAEALEVPMDFLFEAAPDGWSPPAMKEAA